MLGVLQKKGHAVTQGDSDMRIFDYGVNKRVSPATVELIIRERSKGKTPLDRLAHLRFHERVGG